MFAPIYSNLCVYITYYLPVELFYAYHVRIKILATGNSYLVFTELLNVIYYFMAMYYFLSKASGKSIYFGKIHHVFILC